MSEPPRAPIRVVVTDVDIRFTSLVGLLVKGALAAIPALLILGAIFGLLWAVLFGLVFR